MADRLRAVMFARRLVMVSGVVDPVAAGDIAASLLTLDAMGDDPVDIRADAHSDSLDAAFTIMDVVDSMGVAVRLTCSGTLSGTMVGLLAVAEQRVMAAHARVRLIEPRESFGGRATEVAERANHERERLAVFQRRLAQRSARAFEHIEADMQQGRYLSAGEAVAYGLADSVQTRPGRMP